VKFRDNDHVLHVIEKIVSPIGRRIDESSPMVDARLPDGSRVNAIIPPLARLETMVLMAGMELPVKAIREQIASAVDLIVQQSRLRDGSRKITYITEVQGMEGDIVTMQDIFIFEQTGVDESGKINGRLKPTGIRPKFFEKFEISGIRLPPELSNNVH
jgi:Flp pilus assembly CpaF family ATPase